jgi:hypothetical protein
VYVITTQRTFLNPLKETLNWSNPVSKALDPKTGRMSKKVSSLKGRINETVTIIVQLSPENKTSLGVTQHSPKKTRSTGYD